MSETPGGLVLWPPFPEQLFAAVQRGGPWSSWTSHWAETGFPAQIPHPPVATGSSVSLALIWVTRVLLPRSLEEKGVAWSCPQYFSKGAKAVFCLLQGHKHLEEPLWFGDLLWPHEGDPGAAPLQLAPCPASNLPTHPQISGIFPVFFPETQVLALLSCQPLRFLKLAHLPLETPAHF